MISSAHGLALPILPWEFWVQNSFNLVGSHGGLSWWVTVFSCQSLNIRAVSMPILTLMFTSGKPLILKSLRPTSSSPRVPTSPSLRVPMSSRSHATDSNVSESHVPESQVSESQVPRPSLQISAPLLATALPCQSRVARQSLSNLIACRT